MIAQPPYALATTPFRFRALASLASRLPIGGDREVALAAFVAARLAGAVVGDRSLTEELRKARAVGARQWLGALALPANTRAIVTQLAEASTNGDREGLASCVDRLAAQVAPVLDGASKNELRQLAQALRSSEGKN